MRSFAFSSGIILYMALACGVIVMESPGVTCAPSDDKAETGPCVGNDCFPDKQNGEKNDGTQSPDEHCLSGDDCPDEIHRVAQNHKKKNQRKNTPDTPIHLELENALHGNTQVHKSREEIPSNDPTFSGSSALDPEIFLHGSKGHDSVSTQEIEEARSRPKPVFSVLDPHEMIHGTGRRIAQVDDDVDDSDDDAGNIQNKRTSAPEGLLEQWAEMTDKYMEKLWKKFGIDDSEEVGMEEEETEVHSDMRHELVGVGKTGPREMDDVSLRNSQRKRDGREINGRPAHDEA